MTYSYSLLIIQSVSFISQSSARQVNTCYIHVLFLPYSVQSDVSTPLCSHTLSLTSGFVSIDSLWSLHSLSRLHCLCVYIVKWMYRKNTLEEDNNQHSYKSHNFKAKENLAISGLIPLFHRWENWSLVKGNRLTCCYSAK